MAESFEIVVADSSDFDHTFVEIKFPGKCGFIISRERNEDIFDVYVASKNSESWEVFEYGRKIESEMVLLDDLINALQRARDKMNSMRLSR